MINKTLCLLTIAVLFSGLMAGVTLAQPQLRVVQDPLEYYDGCLTSLIPLNAEDAEVIFINGILTKPNDHEAALKAIQGVFPGRNVIGIYNETVDLAYDSLEGLDDLRQGLGLDREKTNLAVDTLLTYLLLYDQPVTIVAHSQGAAIVSAALQQFTQRYPDRLWRLDNILVITLGGFAMIFPPGPQYLHLVYSSDPVPILAQTFSWMLAGTEPAVAQAENRYQANTIEVNDGPAPMLRGVYIADFVFPLPGMQHGLENYLNLIREQAVITAENAARLVELKRLEHDQIGEVAWSPDGQTLAMVGSLGVWLYQANNLLAEPRLLEGHTGPVRSLAWLPDGRLLALGNADNGTVRMWDVASGTQLEVLKGQRWEVDEAAWAPDGRRLASGPSALVDDEAVRVWDVASGVLLAALEGPTWPVTSVAWSPDGRRLAAGSMDGAVWLWDADSGALLGVLGWSEFQVDSVAWSPDGRRLAAGGWEGTVLWDADSLAPLAVLGQYGVLSVAWSPDGRLLAAGSDDGTVRLWDVASGAQLAVLQGHELWAIVAWSPDGRRLASVSREAVRLWGVPND